MKIIHVIETGFPSRNFRHGISVTDIPTAKIHNNFRIHKKSCKKMTAPLPLQGCHLFFYETSFLLLVKTPR